ncbi:hypothetical protein DVK87_27755, partial [Escherichia coli]|nr:hypothetical protein [Escherichia coli]EFO1872184.1 hypothetical protein [Escherichia coli]
MLIQLLKSQNRLPRSRFGLLQPGCFLPQFHWLWHSFRWFSLPSGWTLRWFRSSLRLSRYFSRWFLIFWLLSRSLPMQS